MTQTLAPLKRLPIQLGILAASLGICCLTLWTVPLGEPVMAQQSSPRTLMVTGQGSVAVETSIAILRLGVTVEGTSAEEVQAQVANQTNQVVDTLEDLEVDKLQTTGITLNPQYEYTNGRSRQVGVIGQNRVQFEVPIDRAGSILDQAIESGASQVESVSFRAEESVRLQGRQQALQQAVEDALAQAEVVLGALDLTQESIAQITVNSGHSSPVPMPLLESASLSRVAESAPTPVIGGEQTVNASVTIQIQY